METKTVITIDGPAGAGKSTVARLLARRMGFFFLDTGALYRAMAVHLMRKGISSELEEIPPEAFVGFDLRIEPDVAGMRLFLGSEEVTPAIREEHVSNEASRFSAKPEVRRVLLLLQQNAGRNWNLVAEGRDMGTVVFPGAKIKFFLTADVNVRSRRRYLELAQRGGTPVLEEVRAEMAERDLRDETRREAPLKPAPDAVFIDTTDLSADEVVERMIREIESPLRSDL